jgi:hypothetical protein
MNLEETTQLYASVLRQLLPTGGYDTSPNTEALAVDVYAHAKLLAQADLDGKRLLKVLEELPPELLPEYETEYGLPLKCTVNASRTIEERLQILNWIRTSRNVLNRTYLEQILSIFGVVLIDIVKFKPLLCTAACDSPVNTEQLRYKVFLRLQYPMNADMNCIVENYLPGYLRFDWMIDMPWGEWILNPAVTVNINGIAHYTAYKTNQREYYDSYANLDLTEAIVRSLHDENMQQWQAVKDAIFDLTGSTSYTWETEGGHISYAVEIESKACAFDGSDCADAPYLYTYIDKPGKKYSTIEAAALSNCGSALVCKLVSYTGPRGSYYDVVMRYQGGPYDGVNNYTWVVSLKTNYNYNPNTVNLNYVSFETIAQKIISNTQHSNQATSLLAEAYLENVAQSIFSTDESKQFVKLSDLLSQFELNKTLRT